MYYLDFRSETAMECTMWTTQCDNIPRCTMAKTMVLVGMASPASRPPMAWTKTPNSWVRILNLLTFINSTHFFSKLILLHWGNMLHLQPVRLELRISMFECGPLPLGQAHTPNSTHILNFIAIFKKYNHLLILKGRIFSI